MVNMIWEELPDCLLETIYKKIVISQPENLLEDIKSYNYTINAINDNLELNQFGERHNEWLILIYILDIYYKTKTQEYKTEKFIEFENFVETNNNLSIRYQGGNYWINRFVGKMSISERTTFICYLNGDNI
tara:strand:+ start:5489 stop:5881 length:393 start_codon:yes stop_codon:yes gene_type:complete